MTTYRFDGKTGRPLDETPAKPAVNTGSNGATAGRDPRTGRFGAGNRHGRGNPDLVRIHALRTAFRDAVGPETVAQVAAGMAKAATGGDSAAARVLLEFALGKPRPAPPRAEIGPLEATTAAGVVASFQAILAGVAQGQLELEAATELGRIVEQAAKATCWQDIETRLARVEATR